MEANAPNPTAIDLTGLPPDAVRAVEAVVAQLRAAHKPAPPEPSVMGKLTYEEFQLRVRQLRPNPHGATLPDDWSRADIYDDHD